MYSCYTSYIQTCVWSESSCWWHIISLRLSTLCHWYLCWVNYTVVFESNVNIGPAFPSVTLDNTASAAREASACDVMSQKHEVESLMPKERWQPQGPSRLPTWLRRAVRSWDNGRAQHQSRYTFTAYLHFDTRVGLQYSISRRGKIKRCMAASSSITNTCDLKQRSWYIIIQNLVSGKPSAETAAPWDSHFVFLSAKSTREVKSKDYRKVCCCRTLLTHR